MKKMKNIKATLKASIFTALALFVSLSFFGCDALQDSLHDEMQKKLDEETGIASVDGDTWYFNGNSKSNVAGSTGTSLLLKFNRKVAIGASSTGVSKLAGTLSVSYSSYSGEKSETYTIAKGKIKYLNNSDPNYEGEVLGALNASGTEYRVDMAPVVKFLTGTKAINNELTVELKLSGFVCNEGDQKGRSVGMFSKKIKVAPFFDEETLSETNPIPMYTAKSTLGRALYIKTSGPVALLNADDFTVTDITPSSAANANNFWLEPAGKGFYLYYNGELKNKKFTATITINGFVPVMSGSSYSNTFKLNYTPKVPVTKKSAVGTGSNTVVQLFNASDMAAYDTYESVLIRLIVPEGYDNTTMWGGKEDNWWYLYSYSEGTTEIGNNDSANWKPSEGLAELSLPSTSFTAIHDNGIYIKADTGFHYQFTVTYK